MYAGRWYPSVTPLSNGETLITSGGPPMPEVRRNDGTLRPLTTASLDLPLYPWIDVAPDGKAFYSGPDPTMRSLDTTGGGSWQTLGPRDTYSRDYGSHALYDIGKILVAGGGLLAAERRVINLNGQTPQVSTPDPMAFGRRQFNLTVLADGSVLATGGNSSGAPLVDLNNGVYNAEDWDPATGKWTTLAAEQVTRQYHSTALLLPDGRVLSAGGGICGTCDQVGYLGKNGQVFSPPYLFKKDGSGELAPRPQITAAPSEVTYNSPFSISTPDPASIRKVALVRLGAVTHSVNMEQRYVPLSTTTGVGAINATAPANANIAPPGYYMLFLIDSNGVPSVSKMVRVTDGNPPPPTPNSKIAFSSKRDGNDEIYSMYADGTSPTRLTNNPASDYDPAYSPTAQKIAFTSKRDGNDEIYVMNADGSGVTRLTNNTASDAYPVFSPDGQKIAFTSTRDGNSEIYVMNADGTNQTRLTNNTAFDGWPSFSPDSQKIVFTSLRDGGANFEIYSMNADGTNQTRLTTDPGYDMFASYSPNGQKIAFSSTRDGNLEIYSMNADGTNQTRLTNNPASDTYPAFSPDSSQIAFDSNRDGNDEIYVMKADGTGQTRLTNAAGLDSYPDWHTVDSTPPETTIDSGPSGLTSNPSPTFTFHSSEPGSSFECAIGAASFAPCSGPGASHTPSAPLPDGFQNFRVRATDPAGNTDPTPAVRSFTVDTHAPSAPTLTGTSPSSPANENNPKVLGGAETGSTVRIYATPDCSGSPLASGTPGQLASPGIAVTVADNSTTNLRATATDQAGNTSSCSAAVTYVEQSAQTQKIAFSSKRDGNDEIYSMNADGTSQTRLTNNPASDYDPAYSPTAQKIAFTSKRDGNDEIYVMNADGSGVTRLTNNAASDAYPVFSPDGQKIAFTSTRDGNSEIYVMNADGTNQTRLTNNTAFDAWPSFSPDSQKIVFTSLRDGGVNFEIYSMNADGTNQTRLTTDPGYDMFGSYSPNGQKIAFSSTRDGNLEIYSMNADGTNQTRLTNNPASDTYPAFSPDSSQIAFDSNRDGNDEIYVMKADGTSQTRLTNAAGLDSYPSFSPPPQRVFFSSKRDGNDEIYSMNADGTNQTRLTNNPPPTTTPPTRPPPRRSPSPRSATATTRST